MRRGTEEQRSARPGGCKGHSEWADNAFHGGEVFLGNNSWGPLIPVSSWNWTFGLRFDRDPEVRISKDREMVICPRCQEITVKRLRDDEERSKVQWVEVYRRRDVSSEKREPVYLPDCVFFVFADAPGIGFVVERSKVPRPMHNLINAIYVGLQRSRLGRVDGKIPLDQYQHEKDQIENSVPFPIAWAEERLPRQLSEGSKHEEVAQASAPSGRAHTRKTWKKPKRDWTQLWRKWTDDDIRSELRDLKRKGKPKTLLVSRIGKDAKELYVGEAPSAAYIRKRIQKAKMNLR
jgi:hypothetical protein